MIDRVSVPLSRLLECYHLRYNKFSIMRNWLLHLNWHSWPARLYRSWVVKMIYSKQEGCNFEYDGKGGYSFKANITV